MLLVALSFQKVQSVLVALSFLKGAMRVDSTKLSEGPMSMDWDLLYIYIVISS